MSKQDEVKRGMQAVMKKFGSHDNFIFQQLMQVALGGQSCDITVYDGKPHLGVTVDATFMYALMYGAGAAKMAELLSAIPLSDRTTISIKEIWTILPMPKDGFTEAELAAVNLAAAEEKTGPNGETVRQMISKTYNCKSREEEDGYIRRFLGPVNK